MDKKIVSKNTKIPEKTSKIVKIQPKVMTSKKSRRKIWLKRIAIAALACFLFGVITIIGLFAWVSKDLPDPDKLNDRLVAESTRIYDKTGNTLLFEAGKDVKRTTIKIEDINDYVKWSTIALEDQNFYQHKGFEAKSFIRAVWRKFTGGSMSATSTLTQQFIKNAIVGDDKTYTRKIKELILAVQLERKYSKDEIIMMYLNEVGYGGVNYGVAAASNSYFHKTPKDLTVAEAATLASLVQRPTYFLNNTDDLKWRRDYCLEQMQKLGKISQDEADTAKKEEIVLAKEISYKKAPHFVDYVISQLEDDYGSTFMNQGYKVITSLDWDKQQLAEKAVADNMDNIRNYGGSNASLVNLDSKTGQILAMVGSYDYYAEDYEGQVNVATSPRQPGSSFKPFVYYTAFAKGYTPNTVLFDLKTTFPIESGSYTPQNYSGSTSGPITMQKALGNSLNIPAVKTLYLAGLNNVLDVADSLGYSTLKDRERFGLSLVLGGAEVKLIEHTSAFATLAREGVRHPISSIVKVEDQKGNTIYEWQNQETQVLNQEAAQTLNQALSNPANRLSAFAKFSITGHTTAGKTGTTQEYHDGWAMGYTPSFATGVWVGNNDNSAMNSHADGSMIALPIWNQYMSSILEGLPDEKFNQPPPSNSNKAVLWGDVGVKEKKKVDKYTQKIIPDECLASYPADYIVEKEYTEAHTILYYINKDDPKGSAPKNPKDDPMFTAWETPILEWTKTQPDYFNKDNKDLFESCDLRDNDQKPEITINSPSNNEIYTAKSFSIDVDFKIGTNRTITKTVYKIDETIIDSRTFAPWTTVYEPTNLTAGDHTLKIILSDDKGDQTSASVDFTFSNTKAVPQTNLNINLNTNKNKD